MSIKKGDLVSLDKRCFNESHILPEGVFKIENIESIFFCVVKGPYETIITEELNNSQVYSNIFISADLLYQHTLLEGFPIKYLKRI